MDKIDKYTEGALAKTKKSNEVIKALNAFISMKFDLNEDGAAPEVKFSDNNVVLSISKRDLLICEDGAPVTVSVLITDI